MLFPKARQYLENALAEGQASAISLLVQREGVDHAFHFGHTAHENLPALRAPVDENTLYDLASLTKILCTTSLCFIAESEGRIRFSDPIQKYFPAFRDKKLPLLSLLQHNSGLPAHLEFFQMYSAGIAPLGEDRAVLPWICELKPGEQKQVYSDLGFMLLGFLLEDRYGQALPALFLEKIGHKLHLENTGFRALPHSSRRLRLSALRAETARFAATELCPWRGKILQGEVHDDNTWAMGGAAGHAGLFSTLAETKLCLAHLLRQTRANPEFLASSLPKPGNFHYGFMSYPGLRPFPGPAFYGALGHTGFVGTSAWAHPDSDTVVILLANRVHPSRKDARWVQSRLEFHQILWNELESPST